MDVITRSYFDDFKEKFGYDHISEEIAFEYFVNYCNVSKYFTNDSITPTMLDDIATQYVADVGFDGFAVIANSRLVTNFEELEEVLRADGYLNVKFVFVEAKMTGIIQPESVRHFYDAVLNTFEYALGRHEIDIRLTSTITKFIQHIYSRSAKFENNTYPEVILLFNSLNSSTLAPEVLRINSIYKDLLMDTGLFSKVTMNVQGWKDLGEMYRHSTTKEVVELEIPKQPIPLPKIQKVQQGYLALVPFSEFKKLIIDADDNLKNVFNANVRAYQGENLVNRAIANTLKEGDIAIFTAMNNGITIIAGQMKYENSTLSVSDYQIVNGCQTSHVLYKNRRLDGIDNLQLLVKFIASSDNEIRTKIILGANSQTEVKREQLIALSEVQELIEEYYNTFKGENRLYYERRSKQYMYDNTVPKNKIITIPIQIKAVVSMFIGQPHSIRGYYGSVVEKLGSEEIFSEKYCIDIYYTSALTLYKMNELFTSGFIPPTYRKVKFHLILAARLIAEKTIGKMPALEEKSMEDYCKKLNDLLIDRKRCTALFEDVVRFIKECLGREPIDQDNDSKELTDSIINMANNTTDNANNTTFQSSKYISYLEHLMSDGKPHHRNSFGLEMAMASLTTLIKHAKSRIDIMSGNLFSVKWNNKTVVAQLDDFLKRGGSLRVLMYNYSYDGVVSSPLFRMLAVRSKNGCLVTVHTMEIPGKLEVNGIIRRCNIYVFDHINYRIEFDPNWSKGIIGIWDEEKSKTFVNHIERDGHNSDVHSLDLLDLFKLKIA